MCYCFFSSKFDTLGSNLSYESFLKVIYKKCKSETVTSISHGAMPPPPPPQKKKMLQV